MFSFASLFSMYSAESISSDALAAAAALTTGKLSVFSVLFILSSFGVRTFEV